MWGRLFNRFVLDRLNFFCSEKGKGRMARSGRCLGENLEGQLGEDCGYG